MMFFYKKSLHFQNVIGLNNRTRVGLASLTLARLGLPRLSFALLGLAMMGLARLGLPRLSFALLGLAMMGLARVGSG